MDKIEKLKFNLREKEIPFFSEDELVELLEENKGNIRKASYQGLIIKSEATGLNVNGLETKDSSKYFKMLASYFITTNSGVL